MVRFQWSNGNFYGFNLQVDFTPDDDDGADVELPGEDGEEDDMQSFDADDLDPPGDEDRGCHWCDDSAIMGCYESQWRLEYAGIIWAVIQYNNYWYLDYWLNDTHTHIYMHTIYTLG